MTGGLQSRGGHGHAEKDGAAELQPRQAGGQVSLLPTPPQPGGHGSQPLQSLTLISGTVQTWGEEWHGSWH